MEVKRKTAAVGYVYVVSTEMAGSRSEIERHKDIVIAHCLNSRIALTHMIIDIGGRQGRGRALDLLVADRASVLVVPGLAHLSGASDELAQMLAHYFTPPVGVAHLMSVAERLDTRTAHGRIAVDVLRCMADFEHGGRDHA